MTITELKAKAFDCLIQIENWQRNLQELNKQIAEYKEEPKEEKK